MATWKKIITSGSNADLNQITASAVKFPDDSIPIASLVSDAVTITAGDGLKTGGAVTLGSSVTLDIDVSDFAGTGLSGDGSENINIDSTQDGNIASILTTDLKIGEDAQTKIDFETVNEIHFDVNNTELLNLTGNLVSGSAISTGSFGLLRVGGTSFTEAQLTDAVDNDIEFDGSTANGVLTYKDADEMSVESNLTFDGTDMVIGGGGKVAFRDNGGEYIYSVSDNVLGLAAGSEIDLTATNIDINGAVDISGNTVIGGDLTVNGTTTTVGTTNTEIKDQFIFLASGSAGSNLDAGIIVQSGSAHNSGSALYHDKSDQRWSVAQNMGKTNNGATNSPTQFVTTVKTATVNPSTDSGSYGAGEMHVNTSTGKFG